MVPGHRVANPKGAYFARDRFAYEPDTDQYRCPAGEVLHQYKNSVTARTRYSHTAACAHCALKMQCTRSRRRSIARSGDAEAAAAMHRRATEQPVLLRQRAALSSRSGR